VIFFILKNAKKWGRSKYMDKEFKGGIEEKRRVIMIINI